MRASRLASLSAKAGAASSRAVAIIETSLIIRFPSWYFVGSFIRAMSVLKALEAWIDAFRRHFQGAQRGGHAHGEVIHDVQRQTHRERAHGQMQAAAIHATTHFAVVAAGEVLHPAPFTAHAPSRSAETEGPWRCEPRWRLSACLRRLREPTALARRPSRAIAPAGAASPCPAWAAMLQGAGKVDRDDR